MLSTVFSRNLNKIFIDLFDGPPRHGGDTWPYFSDNRFSRNCCNGISERRLGSLVLPTPTGVWLPEAAPDKSLDRTFGAKRSSASTSRVSPNKNCQGSYRVRNEEEGSLRLCEFFYLILLLGRRVYGSISFFVISAAVFEAHQTHVRKIRFNSR